ncbi:MAG: 3-deoxy-D-manno-octulosonic acid kinase [Xanthomonadales bacterium]|nr:3-deoxy-D-manno-octulosonic acid kinase [Xanthomonadales bacterium]
MNPLTHQEGSALIVYDADAVPQPGRHLFDSAFWARRDALRGSAQGRGSALFLHTEFGPAVLKRYLRGGWAARLTRDRYLFAGYGRARPIAEFHALARLAAAGLPVPQPLAAVCRRSGLFYRGSLLTRRIMPAQTLADIVRRGEDGPGLWRRVGSCIRRFHEHGVVHADLNARNILVDRTEKVYLIDFDRAQWRRHNARACAANLARLRRSVDKTWPPDRAGEADACWAQLLTAYEEDLPPQRAADRAAGRAKT